MTQEQFHQFQDVVKEAGKIAYDYFYSPDTNNESKADGSVVTKIDKEIETILVTYIKEHFPDDAIVGEEHGVHEGNSGFVWHIDPIDGTDNFLRRIPFCAMSIARLGDTAEGSCAIVYNPITKQMFSSYLETLGDVYENEHLCNLTAESLGGKYVVALGRGTKEPWMKPSAYELYKGIGMKYGRATSYGCTALEFAYVAGNKIDAALTYGLYSYDYAAGLFLVKAAGGAISVFQDGAWKLWEGNLKELCAEHGRIIFASHPDTHDEMLDFIGDPKSWSKGA